MREKHLGRTGEGMAAVEIRDARLGDEDAIARVHVDTWRSAYRGIVADAFLAAFSYEERRELWRKRLERRSLPHVLVVDAGGEVVGFACAGPVREDLEDYDGELYALYLREEHQGKGWGRQLFLAAAARLLDDGMTSMMLWVLEGNPTCGFYERFGGRPVFDSPRGIRIGEEILPEIAYGWWDLRALRAEGDPPQEHRP